MMTTKQKRALEFERTMELGFEAWWNANGAGAKRDSTAYWSHKAAYLKGVKVGMHLAHPDIVALEPEPEPADEDDTLPCDLKGGDDPRTTCVCCGGLASNGVCAACHL